MNQAAFSSIDHIDTIVASVYRVEVSFQKEFVLKIYANEQDFRREFYFLKALAGVASVPKVEKVIEPAEELGGAILMQFLEGELLQDRDFSRDLCFELGVNLAMLHENRRDLYGDVVEKKMKDIFRYFKDKFFEELNECKGHLSEKMINASREFFEDHRGLLNGVDGPCIVHRDFRPGNILVKDGKLVGIIDFASARYGFAEQDFCFIEDIKNAKHRKSFINGYSSIRKVPEYCRIIPLLKLGRALAVIGFTVKSGTWNGKDKELYGYYKKFLKHF